MKKNNLFIALCSLVSCLVIQVNAQVVSTFAGSGTYGNTEGISTVASFKNPVGLCIDPSGNIYAVDFNNNKIRKITPAGIVSTFAGSGAASSINGTGTAASFNQPYSICMDASNNFYVAEWAGHTIRKITPSGVVSTFAGTGASGNNDGPSTTATFNHPDGICSDPNGNIYVSDSGNDKVRKITPAGVVSTLASGFGGVNNICIDLSGNLYVAGGQAIYKITATGIKSVFAGSGTTGNIDGNGTTASFNNPVGICIDAYNNIYVGDAGNHKIRKITPAAVVSTFAGTGSIGSANGPALSATFNDPEGICIDASGNLYIGDSDNNKIRLISNICSIPDEPISTTPTQNQIICSNKATVLSAISSGTVNWYASSTSTTVLASGTSYTTTQLAAGNYTFYAGATACALSATKSAITITVNPLPTISVNSGAICSGNSFTINPTGANTYTVNGGLFVVNPVSNTTYSVTGTSSQGCLSSNTAVSSVTVNALPTISVNSGAICSGNSFTINPSGANTYTVNGGLFVVNPLSNANYSVTGTSSQGCLGSNTAVSSVTVNTLPTISVNSGAICSGNSFTINPSGANTYTVNGGLFVVNPLSNATYSVTGKSPQGCLSSNTAVSSVTVNALPTLSVTSSKSLICIGESAVLTAIGATTYTWSTNEIATSITVSPNSQTSYTVNGTDLNGCYNMSIITQSVNLCTGIFALTGMGESLISVYPNPNNGLFTIESHEPIMVIITNPLGQVILNEIVTGKQQFDLQKSIKGLYFINIINGNKHQTTKLILN